MSRKPVTTNDLFHGDIDHHAAFGDDDGLRSFLKFERWLEAEEEKKEAAAAEETARLEAAAAEKKARREAAAAERRARAPLTLQQLQDVQAECMADDIEIDLETMSLWSSAEAQRFFESGGARRPKWERLAAPPAAVADTGAEAGSGAASKT